MKRSGQIIIVSHCLLNANSKIPPLASYSGVLKEAITPFIDLGIGLEATYLGMNRWGMTREQYDHPNFRRHCREILNVSVDQIEAFSSSGYEFLGVLGVNGSPNCGVDKTCVGFSGGEIASVRMVAKQLRKIATLKRPVCLWKC